MLLEAQISAFIGATLLLGAFVLAHQRFPSDFSWFWMAGWTFYVLRFLLDIAGTIGWRNGMLEFGGNVAVATSAILLLLAVVRLVDRERPSEMGVLALWLALIGWSAVSIVFDFAFLLTYTPLYVAFGGIQLVTAYLFYQYLKQYSYSSTPLIVGSMVIWGIHKFDYPLLRPIESLAPYGYILGALLSFTTGLGVMMFLLEDAERKAARERNVANRRLAEFEDLFNNIPDPVFIHDLDGNFLTVNDTAIATLGYSRAEFRSMTPADLVAPPHRDEIADRIDIAATEDHARFDSTHVTADGRTIDVSVNAATISYRGQEAVLAVARDVTERKELEQSLSVVNRILRHDIRSAVNVIKGNAEMATSADATAIDRLETVLEEADRLYEIGEKAQKIERLLADRESQTERVNIAAVLESTVASLHDSYPHVEIDSTIQADLTADVVVGFEEAIDNVLTNAVEHNDEAVPAISVDAHTRDGKVEIRIADNGPGIPADEIEPIQHGEETDLQHTSGLGLWLVYWMVAESGGRLEFAENEPTGAIVTLVVPAA